MARNSEKAMTALARWRRAKMEEEGTDKKNQRRPYLASECDNLQDCERWRQQIIRDISKSVTAIQNAGLGEFRIRDLNDQINKLLREKKHWENRIRELGGRSYSSRGPKMLDREGKEVPGNRGYKYFGAARDLPGVRELFETDAPPAPKKTRAELMKDVDAQYYGFRDDDDGLLVPLELEAEQTSVAAAVAEWKGKKVGEVDDEVDDEDMYLQPEVAKEEALQEAMEAGKEGRFLARVPIPTQTDIEEALLRRKKQELLALYAIDDDVDKIEKDAKMEDEALAKGGLGPVERMEVKEEEESKPENVGNLTPAEENEEVLKPPGDDGEVVNPPDNTKSQDDETAKHPDERMEVQEEETEQNTGNAEPPKHAGDNETVLRPPGDDD